MPFLSWWEFKILHENSREIFFDKWGNLALNFNSQRSGSESSITLNLSNLRQVAESVFSKPQFAHNYHGENNTHLL